MELEMYLGISEEDANNWEYRGTDEGSKLSGNSDLWLDGVLENNSEFGTSGFTGLPTGYRSLSSGGYSEMGNNGSFWSTSEYSSGDAWNRWLTFYGSTVSRNLSHKQAGISIRCLGD